jgi:hypothetical protein
VNLIWERGAVSGTGWLPWGELREQYLSDLDCLWLDLGGLQVRAAVAEPPIATHLWGWSADRLVRVRLDRGQAVAAVLDRDSEGAVALEQRRGSVVSADHLFDAGSKLGSDLAVVRTLEDQPLTFLSPLATA